MRHFNQLTPAEAERLALLMEEMGETQQAIGKVLRHGYESTHPDGGPTNRETLERELGDVKAAVNMLIDSGDLNMMEIDAAALRKRSKVRQYMHHQDPYPTPKPDDAVTREGG